MAVTKLGSFELGPGGECEGIYTGDARLLSNAIPDESIDLIFTDPVYQNIDDYRWLAETGARALKDGGNCIVQVAHEHLPAICQAMIAFLDWVWILAERLDSRNARIWAKRVFVAYKPWLWLSRGSRKGFWVRDLGQSSHSKQFHVWGDGVGFMTPYISACTDCGSVVFDPFTGGGTVPVVCKMLGRQYLAFEICPETAELARERVQNTQPPLPGLVCEQLEL